MTESGTVNIAHYLEEHSRQRPFQRAIVFPESRDRKNRVAYTQWNFAQLNGETDRIAHALSEYGIGRGTRTVLMVRPCLEFFSLTFALFKVGAVPVLIDPGMGRKRLLECIAQVEPKAMVGIPQAHVARLLFPLAFRTMDRFVTVGRKWFWDGVTLDGICEKVPYGKKFDLAPTGADETAAILFTTGSTGPAKGVVYEHGVFDAQTRWLQERYGIEPGEIDLPGFPLFALFSCAMGMTCVIPDMDPTRPAQVNPARIVEAILNHGCTNSFGSPAIWNRVSRFCVAHKIQLSCLKRVLMAGAPAPPDLVERMAKILPEDGDCHTPYGATESLPVASISGEEITGETGELARAGKGTCVGKPFDGVEVRVIRISDEPIDHWSDDLLVPDGTVGEIVVKGRIVTKEYLNRPKHTRMAKIADGAEIRHRMGDVGYLDEAGRLWFCGRKKHRVVNGDKIWFSVPCEAVFNEHPEVYRSALVGVGKRDAQKPVIVVECESGEKNLSKQERRRLTEELLELGGKNPVTAEIDTVLFHHSFPVDIRHNAKIFREKLAAWATMYLEG